MAKPLVLPFTYAVAALTAPESAALATMVTTEGLKLGAGGVLQFRPTASQVSRMRELMSDRGGFWSGVLGTMPPLDTLRVWEDSLRLPLRKESLFQAARVLIGRRPAAGFLSYCARSTPERQAESVSPARTRPVW